MQSVYEWGGVIVKRYISLLLVLTMLLIGGCGMNPEKKITEEKDTGVTEESTKKEDKYTQALKAAGIETPIVRVPYDACFEGKSFPNGKLPSVDEGERSADNAFSLDVRGTDLTGIDLNGSGESLLNFSTFDTETKWPKGAEIIYDYKKIFEYGKDPGLGVKKLHEAGITGKGVGIGIIDDSLAVNHEEIKDRLRYYGEIGVPDNTASMHGAAVFSIAAGKTVGVAPEADLYYIGPTCGTINGTQVDYDFTNYAEAIERFLKINEYLPEENKIRVISISAGWMEEDKGYDKIMGAVKHANEEGVLVVSSSIDKTNGYDFDGLGRNPLSDPNELSGYRYGSFYIDGLCKNYDKYADNIKNTLFVPMDSRTTASCTGNESYAYYAIGGWSWSIPYIAGVYAMACQVNPDITYDEFWKTSLDTADTVDFQYKDKEYSIPKIICPEKIMDAIK